MTVLTRIDCPASQFVLRQTMETLVDAQFEFERVVASPSNAESLVWVGGPDEATIRETLAVDPSVRAVTIVASAGDGWLVRVRWDEDSLGFVDVVRDVDGTVWEATGAGGNWSFQVLFPGHESLSAAYEQLSEADSAVDITAVHELDSIARTTLGLTEKERETLVTAYDHGYYDVPHRISTAELGELLGVSHQAVSQRLRRGHGSLVGHTLVAGHGDSDPDREDETSR